MKRFVLLPLLLAAGVVLSAEEPRYRYTGTPEAVMKVPFKAKPVEPDHTYCCSLRIFVHSFMPGALIGVEVAQYDASGMEIARAADGYGRQPVTASGMERDVRWNFRTHPQAASAKVFVYYGGNPVDFTVKGWELTEVEAPFPGVYDPKDPDPADRAAALEAMKAIPPAKAEVVRRNGVPVLLVDGKELLVNAYKGDHDYRIIGEAGGDLILTFNCGQRLFISERWDKALWDPEKKKFDFTSIEDNLLRIHKANPNARVIVTVEITPPREWLEAHPESMALSARGVRGKQGFAAFNGWSNAPLTGREKWAWSYTSGELQQFLAGCLKELVRFLKQSPAGNIVIGFKLAGGHDAQFVQWDYGTVNGHFDYSESNRRALCDYLREIYHTDAALQQAWGDPKVTLDTAANPTMEEFRRYKYFNDKPGPGRKLADCRRFIAVGTARMLNFMARTIKAEWGRPAIVEVWYSTTIWAQPSRLALDELVKDGAVNMVGMVSNYGRTRTLDGQGASANSCVQALNLRNVIYIQELDHRTWRTQRLKGESRVSIAFPDTPEQYRNQIFRDASSVIALGGQGFYLFDMYGSWYHAPEAAEIIRTIFAMNRHAKKYAGKFAPKKAAVFMDEAMRLMSEDVPMYVDSAWRTSGVVPALHFLSDLTRDDLPEYDLYIVWSPLTITKAQADKLRELTDRKGKVLYLVGDAGRCSRDFSGTSEVLKRLGLQARDVTASIGDAIAVKRDGSDPILRDLPPLIGVDGAYLTSGGNLRRRYQSGYAVVTDPEAKVLGEYERSHEPAFTVKRMPGGGLFYYSSRNGTLGPRLLHNLAEAAGIRPFSAPGNAVFVGNGVAAVHRLSTLPPEVDFGRETTLIDPVSGKITGKTRFWRPQIAPGECAVTCYLPPDETK